MLCSGCVGRSPLCNCAVVRASEKKRERARDRERQREEERGRARKREEESGRERKSEKEGGRERKREKERERRRKREKERGRERKERERERERGWMASTRYHADVRFDSVMPMFIHCGVLFGHVVLEAPEQVQWLVFFFAQLVLRQLAAWLSGVGSGLLCTG